MGHLQSVVQHAANKKKLCIFYMLFLSSIHFNHSPNVSDEGDETHRDDGGRHAGQMLHQ